MNLYLDELVPGITEEADDNNYGSAAMQDVLCLQALSKRIHYGKFVAEAKYRAAPEQYQALIRKHDQDGIMQLLTNESVEQKVCCVCHLMLLYCPVPLTSFGGKWGEMSAAWPCRLCYIQHPKRK